MTCVFFLLWTRSTWLGETITVRLSSGGKLPVLLRVILLLLLLLADSCCPGPRRNGSVGGGGRGGGVGHLSMPRCGCVCSKPGPTRAVAAAAGNVADSAAVAVAVVVAGVSGDGVLSNEGA